MRYGILRHDDAGRCLHPPTRQEPLILTSSVRLYHCPCRELPDEVWAFMDLAVRTHEEGIPPERGGWLDQSAHFVTAYRVWRGFEALAESIIRKREDGR